MTNIPEEVRKQVRYRALNRCEYCLSHQNYVMGKLQIDHIQPIAKGGSESEFSFLTSCT